MLVINESNTKIKGNKIATSIIPPTLLLNEVIIFLKVRKPRNSYFIYFIYCIRGDTYG